MSLTAEELVKAGFPKNKTIGLALEIAKKVYAGRSEDEQLETLKRVLANPESFLNDEVLSPLAHELLLPGKKALEPSPKPYRIFGAEAIEEGALAQMEIAMRLPVALAGALMPDAHQGYGLPIGGVLATANEVIPYGVGVDIGCRMCMTLYHLPPDELEKKKETFTKILVGNTRFGQAVFPKPADHPIFERKEFDELPIAREMKSRARQQIGTSGGGNHFVEFGAVEILEPIKELNVEPGWYLALLSHSGSRGLGANIARHYTKIAMDTCELPGSAKHLAWLDLRHEAGQEYWLAMNLAGDYASACHHVIHERIASALGETPVAMIENFHNFAWKEKDAQGNDIIVHRKGATPAAVGALGIIPGSMASPGFIVRGKGSEASLHSASHGAGRVLSRTKAKQTLLPGQVRKVLKQAGVEVIGSGLDEAPMVYKDIRQVMEYQKDLVQALGIFTPKIVRMCGDEKFKEAD